MTNIFPGLFEDGHLKAFTESMDNLAKANTEMEIVQAVQQGFSALENVGDINLREGAKQRLRFMEEQARIRIEKK
ncbi:hypothetical protein ACFL5G_00115 [Candidatus Margulisiibacteriota bacterium]